MQRNPSRPQGDGRLRFAFPTGSKSASSKSSSRDGDMGSICASELGGVDGPLIEDVLCEYGELIRSRMNRYLPKLEPRRYLYELLADYPTRGGKMLRSSLCIAMARATGAEMEDAIPSAVSIELNGDLYEGKRTLMFIYAFRNANASERRRLTAFMGRARAARSDAEVAWMRDLIERTGAMDHARTVAQALAGAALREFDAYFAHSRASRDRQLIRNMIVWALRRRQ